MACTPRTHQIVLDLSAMDFVRLFPQQKKKKKKKKKTYTQIVGDYVQIKNLTF
jgi:hypothetical protein